MAADFLHDGDEDGNLARRKTQRNRMLDIEEMEVQHDLESMQVSSRVGGGLSTIFSTRWSRIDTDESWYYSSQPSSFARSVLVCTDAVRKTNMKRGPQLQTHLRW